MANRHDSFAGSAGRHLSLRFLSGRCKGSEYVLDEGQQVTVGRTHDADIVLLEGIVSRRHARFVLLDGQLSLEDLKSTNGTFVNGERVRRRRLEQSDRVLIGTSILKVVWSTAPVGTVPPRPSQRARMEETGATTVDRKMSGRLEEMGVPELLEMLCSADLAGLLVLKHAGGEGRITVRAGQVEQVSLSSLAAAPADKVLFRLLSWSEGTFSIRPYRPPRGDTLELSIRHLLVDTLFKLDDLGVLRTKLPGGDEPLVLPRPLRPPLHGLNEAELELLQLAHNLGTVQAVLDASPDNDWATAQRLLRLLDAGYLHRG